MESHGIGWAVKQMHGGYRVRRSGWNGKNMWVTLERSDQWEPEEGDFKWQPFIVMFTAQSTYVPWLASQTDLLATDWELAK